MAEPLEVLTARIESLAETMTEGFAGVGRRLDGIDGRLDGIDGRLDAHDGRFDSIDDQLRDIPAHFTELRSYIDTGLEKTQTTLKAEIGRVERKLDQFIDGQLRR
ncbi:MAG: hypothetical protein WD690_10085 [Vicinamibacterales bacterium]